MQHQDITTRIQKDGDIYLSKLFPNEILDILGSSLSWQQKIRVSRVCRHTFSFFREFTTQEHLANLLGQYIVDGEYSEVKALLNYWKHPNWLLMKITVTNKAGQTVHGTPYQLALGSGNSVIAQMIVPFFAKLENGEKELANQYNAQFPPPEIGTYFDYVYVRRFDYNKIIAILAADPLENGKMNEATKLILQAFQIHLTPNPEEIINSGLYFDMREFIAAMEALNDKNKTASPLNHEQRLIYCAKVLGFLQKLFPVFDAQLFSNGLFKKDGFEGKPNLYLEDGSYFYSEKLGDTHYIICYQAVAHPHTGKIIAGPSRGRLCDKMIGTGTFKDYTINAVKEYVQINQDALRLENQKIQSLPEEIVTKFLTK